MNETYAITFITTPPDNLPHKERKFEILELADYIAVRKTSPDGAAYVLTDETYQDENRDKVLIKLDPSSNDIFGIYTFVSGKWKQWLIPQAQLLYIPDGETLVTEEEPDDNGHYVMVAKPRVDGTTMKWVNADGDEAEDEDALEDLVLKSFITADALPVGRGLTTRTVDGDTFIDVLPDGVTLELVSVDDIYRVQVKDNSIGPEQLNKHLAAQVATTTLSYAYNDSAVATPIPIDPTSLVPGQPSGTDSKYVVTGTAIVGWPAAGWYRVSLTLNVTIAAAFDDTYGLLIGDSGADGGWLLGNINVPTAADMVPTVCVTGLIYVAAVDTSVSFTATPVPGAALSTGALSINSSTITMEFVGGL